MTTVTGCQSQECCQPCNPRPDNHPKSCSGHRDGPAARRSSATTASSIRRTAGPRRDGSRKSSVTSTGCFRASVSYSRYTRRRNGPGPDLKPRIYWQDRGDFIELVLKHS